MERRGFLKGILTGIAGATASVTLATPQEVAALTSGAPVVLGQPEPVIRPVGMCLAGEMLYVKLNGKFEEVGYCTDVSVTMQALDHTAFFDGGFAVSNPGLISASGRFKGRF